jgi:hypothetical protein
LTHAIAKDTPAREAHAMRDQVALHIMVPEVLRTLVLEARVIKALVDLDTMVLVALCMTELADQGIEVWVVQPMTGLVVLHMME